MLRWLRAAFEAAVSGVWDSAKRVAHHLVECAREAFKRPKVLPVAVAFAVGGTSSVGQFDAAGVFQNISGTSTVGTGFDVPQALPSPPGGVILPGDTLHFQLWYRDGPNSNFSDAITVNFP